MKKVLLFVFVALLPLASFSQQGYQLDLNRLGAITFPDTPKSTYTGKSKVFTLAADSVVYIATAAPIGSVLGVFGNALNNSFYNGVIKGSLRQAHGKLIYRKNIKLGNLTGIEFGYKAAFDSVNYYCYHQAYDIKNTLVFYGYWSRDSLQSDDKKMRAFFGSFKPSKRALAVTANPFALDMRRALWIFFIVIMVLGAGVAIILLIRRMRPARQ